MSLDNDELRILRILDIPRTKSELSELTDLEDERVSTILQMLKRNDFAQLMEGKRWQRTELGNRRLLEEEKEPEVELKPPHEESITKRFEINQKKRALLRDSEELSSILSKWGWEDDLLKDAESLREDAEYIVQCVNEIKNMEGLEETEKILEDLNCSFGELLFRDDRMSAVKSNQEREEKLGRIREFYTEIYPGLTQEELEEMIMKCRKDPERARARLSRVWRKAKDLGFKTPEEYMLFEELRKNDVEVRHNVHLLGTEVDLYVPPKLVIEVGFRDEYLMKKWDAFEREGFSFLYFSNIEIRDPDALKRCVGKVMTSIQAESNNYTSRARVVV